MDAAKSFCHALGLGAVNRQTKKMYCVILCGGKGERLWPYSTPQRPKQLIPFRNGKTLLELTIDRCKKVTQNIWLACGNAHHQAIKQVVDHHVKEIIVEPVGRNTAPAILLSCLALQKKDPDAVVAFLPADHHIPDSETFAASLRVAFSFADNADKICLLGLKPRHPAVSYGYIEMGEAVDKQQAFFSVVAFHEKPTKARAKQYVADKNKLWNMGIFIGRVKKFIEEYKRHLPGLFDQMVLYHQTNEKTIYASLPNLSIDYAIMEKSKECSVLPVNFDWSDVGDLAVFLSLQEKFHGRKDVMHINASRNVVDVKGKQVILVGVHNLCIIEHENKLLIVQKEALGDVRKIARKFTVLGEE